MKKLFFIVIMVMVTVATAHANDEVCEKQANLAAQIMEIRQMGLPMSDQLAVSARHPNSKAIFDEMIIYAYSKPRFNTEKYRKDSISEFRNEVHFWCLKTLRNNQ